MIYIETSGLLDLYLKRKKYVEIQELLIEKKCPITVWTLTQLEMSAVTASMVQAKVMTKHSRDQLIMNVSIDKEFGRINFNEDLPFQKVFNYARILTNKPKFRYRSIDTLHVSAAVTTGAEMFIGSDGDQSELARKEGLNVFP